MTEQETIFHRPETSADKMFAAVALNVGVAVEMLGTLAEKKREDLQPIIRLEIRRLLEMLGLRANKTRRPLFRRLYQKPA